MVDRMNNVKAPDGGVDFDRKLFIQSEQSLQTAARFQLENKL